MKNKIAVLGSNSFSGSDFIDFLLQDNNNDVVGISRSREKSALFLPYKRHEKPQFKFYQMDFNNDMNNILALLDSYKPDYIINFAAQSEVAPSWEHPEHWYETNCVSLAKLGNHLRKKNYFRRYVHISSPEVYGTCVGVVREDGLLNPTTPYAASKAAADLFLFTLVKNFDFPMVMIRSTNVYGAHQQLFKIIPRSVISIKSGRTIHLHGGGKAVKSYIHIRDISEGEYSAMKKGKEGEIYHLSPDRGVSVKEVVKLICDRMGVDFKKMTTVAPERLGQDRAYIIDSAKARKSFHWKPKVTLEEGIAGVIDWVDKYWEEIKKMPLDYIHKP